MGSGARKELSLLVLFGRLFPVGFEVAVEEFLDEFIHDHSLSFLISFKGTVMSEVCLRRSPLGTGVGMVLSRSAVA